MSTTLPALGLLALVPAAGMAAVRGFDGLYGQDAYAYFGYATGPLRDALERFEPPWSWPAFFWPPGYPLLVALISFATGPIPLAGQLVSLLMGALVPVCTALLARELVPHQPALALLAGALVGLSGQLWQSSMVVMADTTGLALATLAAWCLARYAHRPTLRWLLFATAAMAGAILARWIYALVAIPFAIDGLANGRRPAHIVGAALLGAALLAPILGPPLLKLLQEPSVPASFAGNLQVYSWSPLNAVRSEFTTADGLLRYAQANGVYYAIAPANPALFGPLLAPVFALGVWAAFRTWTWTSIVLIGGWAAIVYAFHAGAAWQNLRFTLAYLPPLAILMAAGLVWAWRLRDRRSATAVVAVALVGVGVMLAGGARVTGAFVDRKDADLAMVRWVERQTPPSATLLTFGPTLTFRHYSRLATLEIFELSPAQLPNVQEASYLLVDETNVEQQWQNRTPQLVLHAFRDGPGLTPLGQFASFTLFRVGSV